jgi:hypothetical protein
VRSGGTWRSPTLWRPRHQCEWGDGHSFPPSPYRSSIFLLTLRPSGEINLNITLARPPPGMAFPDPPPPPPWETNDTHPDVGTDQPSNQNQARNHHRRGRRGSGPPDAPGKTLDICSLPPVIVDIFAASESSTLRFVDWEETCRGLRLDVVSLIGDVNSEFRPRRRLQISKSILRVAPQIRAACCIPSTSTHLSLPADQVGFFEPR